MTIRVQYFAQLRDALGRSEETLTLEGAATAGRALEALCRRHPQLAACRKMVRLAIGVEWVKPDALLKEGDVLLLMPPVQGG